MRREISKEGLWLAFAFLLGVLGLVGSIVGFAMGAEDGATTYATIGGISLILVVGLAYTHLRPAADDPAAASASHDEERPVVERLIWGGMLALSLAGLFVVDPPFVAVSVVLLAVSVWNLVAAEIRRRRATRGP